MQFKSRYSFRVLINTGYKHFVFEHVINTEPPRGVMKDYKIPVKAPVFESFLGKVTGFSQFFR